MLREKFLFKKGNSKSSTITEEIGAFMGKESLFEGKMTFQGIFRMDGKFEGEIIESGTLIIGESAVLKGKIGVNAIVINGLVEGEVNAQERVEIHSTGKLYGNLFTPILTINEGGIFEGHCKMEKAIDREHDLQSHPQNVDYPLSS